MTKCVTPVGAQRGRRLLPMLLLGACGLAAGAPAVASTFVNEPSTKPIAGDWLLFERNALLAHVGANSILCFDENITKEQLEAIEDRIGLWPAAYWNDGAPGRYVTTTRVWFGEGTNSVNGVARGANLTYSFPDDGVTWGLSSVGFGTAPNNLNQSLINASTIGQGNPDRLDFGRELIRQALAGWQFYSGLNYREVGDNNEPMNESIVRSDLRGDIRIGAYNLGGQNGTLAYNAFPAPASGVPVVGGDMAINSAYFTGGSFNSAASNWRFFRNTVAHEHGHGTGFIHTVPCNNTKLMEPAIFTSQDMQRIDDIRGAQRNYGDRHYGNNSANNAHDLGDLTNRSVAELFLSTNGTSGFDNSGEDWFRFTLDEARPIVITLDPTGGAYIAGQQSFGCNGPTGTITADQAGNLILELRDAAGNAVIADSTSGAAGVSEVISLGTLAAGEYTIRVRDTGPNLAGNQFVQLYDLFVRVNSINLSPVAVPGINKRIEAGETCFFIGDVNSRATQQAATIFTSGYDWDLDGDGVFETTDNRQPTFQYPSNGDYTVTLRVTDSFNSQGTGTMVVTVFGATTSLDSVTPDEGEQGATVPVVFTGVNLKNVENAGEFTVSGAGVTVVGTPMPNALGTEVTGLSLMIDPGAPTGVRTITVTNDDGFDTLVGAFEVLAGAIECPGDTNGDNIVNFTDLNTVLSTFGQTGPGLAGDVNGDNIVNFSDLNEVLSNFGLTCN
ncbi:MAG: PKD domain-containing protein [Phycisphaerales bacterium]